MGHDVIYVSPHPDDAVFSAGGAIALDSRAGLRVAVVTAFSATEELEAERREEDRRAIERLGAERIELQLPEAPRRDLRYRKPSWLFAPLRGTDLPLVDQLAAALGQVCEGARVVGPLGVGQHVDHQVTHAACERVGCDDYYEDVPYALARFSVARRLALVGAAGLERGGRLAEARATARWWAAMPIIRDRWSALLRPVALAALVWPQLFGDETPTPSSSGTRWHAEARDVGAILDDKVAAIAEYASQWPLFFRSLEACRAALDEHGERRWRHAGRDAAGDRSLAPDGRHDHG